MATTSCSPCWIVVFVPLVLETLGLFCLAQYDLQCISGCDYTYVEQPASDLSCDPYGNGVAINCAVIGLQGSSIEWYRSDSHGRKEMLAGDVTMLETLVIQGRLCGRRNSTLTIDESALESGQQYWCQVRVGGELIQQSNTLLIESRNYYTSRGYVLCSNHLVQFTAVPKCADMDVKILQPANRKLAILVPIWLCVFICALVVIAMVVIDRKRKRKSVTQRSPCQAIVRHVTPQRDIDDGNKYTSSDDIEHVNPIYINACTTIESPVPTTDEDRTVYQRCDPDTHNYIFMHAKPTLQHVRSPPAKESEYQLIDRSRLDPENPYAIGNRPAKKTEGGMYQLLDSCKPDQENPYAIVGNPPTKETREGVYQLLDSRKLAPENPYAIVRNPSTKERRGGV